MARGGINKVLVSKARETLISRGENPSIDAIRVELGNTGSKSTIHRYLREIEEEASARLDDESLLSQPIKELVGRLAAALKQEAQATLETALANSNKTHEEKECELQRLLIELSARETSEEVFKTQENEFKQTEAKLQAMLVEKQSHIESLEEKHRHNREAMEHYRQSVKEQRDQDQRKYEQQAQQLQAEIRSLNQTISVKQSDLTQLNKDNGRFVAELGAAQKTVVNLESEQRKLAASLESKAEEADSLKAQLSEFKTQSVELNKLKKLNEELQAWKAEASVSIGKLEAEIAVKTDMMNRLLEEKKKAPEEC